LVVYVTRSEYGAVAASTMVGASCSASATMPDGRRIELGGQTANEQGIVAWSYPATSPAPVGQGVHMLTCSSRGLTASTFAYFEVGA
jgi:hypothetical protein